MNRIAPLSLAIFALAAGALAADGGNVRGLPAAPQWSFVAPGRSRSPASKADTLGGSGRAAIAKFVNANLPPHWMSVPVYSVVESGRASVGDGKYDLVVLLDISGRGYSNTLMIYRQDTAGSWRPQVIYGWRMGDLKHMVRDLNGDGVDELIITKQLGERDSWFPLMDMPAWPAVYRLENGKYVEASRDFPDFYDAEILPGLDKAIAKMQQKAAESVGYGDAAARLTLERNKILRALGRNPTAGLDQAYQWMSSDDPQLLQCAMSTFAEIGGHEGEVRKLRQALPAAIKRQMKSRRSG